jgi:DNA invertase Pin-like site-specific DNA recombinase
MKRKPTDIVGYLRTSTEDQKLGIDAQQFRLQEIAKEKKCVVSRVFTEHESGGDPTRPELDKAIRHARRVNATLVVAKLDRLARDSGFLMRLYDGNVPIVFGDLPEVDGSAAGRLMVQMMANIAEFERRRIGERTREVLKVLKANGVKLGTPRNLTRAGRLKGAAESARKRVTRAIDEQSDIAEIATQMRAAGSTLGQIAQRLNVEGYATRENGAKGWSRIQVKRVLDRAEAPK